MIFSSYLFSPSVLPSFLALTDFYKLEKIFEKIEKLKNSPLNEPMML